jgi:release factor glutamine methyltransferase
MRLSECLAHGAVRLRAGPHPDRAQRDAETLLLHLIGKNRAWLIAHAADEFGGCTAIRYAGLLERRFAGEPIQYITGEAEFFALPFRVTRDVLIPRPETEHLVEKTIELAAAFPTPRIVDVGTGSGAIAIALARSLRHTEISSIDLSPAALEVARENARLNGVADRVRFYEGDLLEPFRGESFDLVISNPPYVPDSDRPTLAVEVREYEPSLALFAGQDGLAIYRRLIPDAAKVLCPGGVLVLEIGFGQATAVGELMKTAGFEWIESTPDLQGIPRVMSGQCSKSRQA